MTSSGSATSWPSAGEATAERDEANQRASDLSACLQQVDSRSTEAESRVTQASFDMEQRKKELVEQERLRGKFAQLRDLISERDKRIAVLELECEELRHQAQGLREHFTK